MKERYRQRKNRKWTRCEITKNNSITRLTFASDTQPNTDNGDTNMKIEKHILEGMARGKNINKWDKSKSPEEKEAERKIQLVEWLACGLMGVAGKMEKEGKGIAARGTSKEGKEIHHKAENDLHADVGWCKDMERYWQGEKAKEKGRYLQRNRDLKNNACADEDIHSEIWREATEIYQKTTCM